MSGDGQNAEVAQDELIYVKCPDCGMHKYVDDHGEAVWARDDHNERTGHAAYTGSTVVVTDGGVEEDSATAQSSGGIDRIEEIEPDGDIGEQPARWFRGMLLNCIMAAPEADRDEKLRIRGRLFVLRDLFALSESDIIELAEETADELGDEVAEVFEVGK